MPNFTTRVAISCTRLLLVCTLSGGAASAAPAAVKEEQFNFQTFSFARISLQEGESAPVRYYLSKPAQKAPLVLYIQG